MIVINVIQAMRVFSFVSFRPLLHVTYRTYRLEIHTRNDISRALLLYKI